MPDSLKITFPLMTVLADGRYVGLVWDMHDDIAAVFDSPDRLFKSGGHAMGLIFPGANGANRMEGSLLPTAPQTLAAGKPLKIRANLIGGKATSVIPAVQQYVAMRGLPDLPALELQIGDYAKLAAAGWLQSKAREGDLYRHAWPGQFRPQASADAALLMDWLAARTADGDLRRQLSAGSAQALAQVKPASYDSACISHNRYPAQSLFYGHVAENAARAQQHGEALLKQFLPDGTLRYKPQGTDYGKTHFAPDANGLTATTVNQLLQCATISGDAKLISESLRLLRAMDKFADTAPRGAQTWECPLHTPDILASAYMVRCYTIGYELTGDAHLLDMARHWAWTGVPFVYLRNPTSRPIGPYATIAVYGATSWVAPNWMGLPVQWCGLVYAESLYHLAELEPAGPWKKIADGITASGIQQTWPQSEKDRQGLLPDSFVLRQQMRANPGINPGTVQVPAIRFYKQPPLYSVHCFRPSGLIVHAPGSILDAKKTGGEISFKVSGCFKENYYILIAGCKSQPRLRVNGVDAPAEAIEYAQDSGRLVLRLKGESVIHCLPALVR